MTHESLEILRYGNFRDKFFWHNFRANVCWDSGSGTGVAGTKYLKQEVPFYA